MKPVRVTITCTVIVGLILAILFVPLPVSRVTAVGVVQMEPDAWEPVYVAMAQNKKAILREVYVKDGDTVRKDDPLARFSNREYEEKLETARLERSAYEDKLKALDREKGKTQDPRERDQFNEEIRATAKELRLAQKTYEFYARKIEREGTVRAPISGTVMSPPRIDVVDKLWDEKQPLCKIGDPTQLRVLIPVEPADYNLLQENLRAKGKVLPVSVRVPGMGRQFWYGEVKDLPPSEATNIPVELSSKTDGPVPVIPNNNNPDQLVPQTQQYLVAIELIDADDAIRPGVRAKVKVHCKKRSMGWYIWRSINDTFNLGLL